VDRETDDTPRGQAMTDRVRAGRADGAPQEAERDFAMRRDELLELVAEKARLGPFSSEWTSLREYGTPEWIQDAKLGIFISWLVSSVPGFGTEWYARNMYVAGTPEFEHHRVTYGAQSEFGFKDLIPAFTGERFDADDWMDLVQASGARYVVPVAEHHDGFALYDSALTHWNATEMGPRRDVIGEIATAARARGIVFGLSNHRAENWWFFNGGRKVDSDVQDPSFGGLYGPAQPLGTQPDDVFLDDWTARLVEMVERYDPDLVYFDFWIEQPAFRPRLAEFAAYYYNRAHSRGDVSPVINYKWEAFEKGSAVYDIERGTAQGIEAEFFQNDTSISRIGWGYLDENVFKSAQDVIGELIDVVSKNGTLLLNIGPRPDGSITDEERAVLEGLGAWLRVNGEAIYGSRPWKVFGEGPTQPRLGSFADSAPTVWTPEDFRFTSNGDAVYVSPFVDPGATIEVRSLGSAMRVVGVPIREVSVLGFGPVSWVQDPDALRVDLSGVAQNGITPVIRVDLEPEKRVERYEPSFPD
jgi:alpha-L-fucosidase